MTEKLRPARRVVTIRAGSHLYGTATARSDLDVKFVTLPSGSDILLQRAAPSQQGWAGDDRGEAAVAARPADGPSGPGLEDAEGWSLQRFLGLVCAGQPIALEMLFAPRAAMLSEPDPWWDAVRALAPMLVTRTAGVFARYCRLQAEKYGAKGERVAAARTVLGVLDEAETTHGTQARLAVVEPELRQLAGRLRHVGLEDIAGRAGSGQVGKVVQHLQVCGRRVPFTASLRTARGVAERLIAGYGERTLAAERERGVDWKSMSHAVRVGREAVELFTTGRLEFPLHCAAHLLAIKLGRVQHEAVEAEIDELVARVERAALASALPATPDVAAAERLVQRAHLQQVGAG